MAEKDKITCVKHGNDLILDNFYIAGSNSVFSGIGRIPICKNCLYDMVTNYYKSCKDMKLAIYYICRKIDVAFDSNVFDSSLRKGKKDAKKVFQSYMVQYNSLGQTNGIQLSFDDGEHVFNNDEDTSEKNDITEKNDIEIYEEVQLTEEDLRIKNEVIELLEFDPFEGYSESDQKFLYNDLYNYFGNEDIFEDKYLLSQIIQIVNNNNQIRKIDYLISQYTAHTDLLVKNEGKVKSLNSIKKDIVVNNDKIAKENRISVRHRKGDNIKKSSLTVMMEYLRSLGFEDAEVDYYDQKKAYGMQRVANISMKAMAEQMQFDENDTNDIILYQRELIKEMEEKVLDIEEENRKLHIEIEKYKNKHNQ